MRRREDDTVNIDPDFILAQDENLEDTTGQIISWTQWDAWFGDLNMAHNNLGTSFNDGPAQQKLRRLKQYYTLEISVG